MIEDPIARLWLGPGGSCRFLSVRLSDNKKGMGKQAISDNKKKGRPATGQGLMIGVRLQPDLLELVDIFRAQLRDRPGRPEAIRRLITEGLMAKGVMPVDPGAMEGLKGLSNGPNLEDI